MSRQHMQDVLASLEARGWVLRQIDGEARGNEDPFRLHDSAVRWGIALPRKDLFVELEFHAFGLLGERTDNPSDIFYCVVMKKDARSALSFGDKLRFSKRNKADWSRDRERFVASLENPKG